MHVHFDQEFLLSIHVLQKAFLGLSRNIGILSFQKGYKKVLQNAENSYLVVKNPRAPTALRWALDPSQLRLTLFI